MRLPSGAASRPWGVLPVWMLPITFRVAASTTVTSSPPLFVTYRIARGLPAGARVAEKATNAAANAAAVLTVGITPSLRPRKDRSADHYRAVFLRTFASTAARRIGRAFQ